MHTGDANAPPIVLKRIARPRLQENLEGPLVERPSAFPELPKHLEFRWAVARAGEEARVRETGGHLPPDSAS